MTPPALKRPAPSESTASDRLVFGAVHLDVTDAERSLAFWRDLIGLQELGRSADAVRLGVEDRELLVLHPGAVRPWGRGHSGLYHVAIHLPDEAEFARVLQRLFEARHPNAPTDHVMHWATYLDDPDGIGLELSFETLDRFDRWVSVQGMPAVVHRDGRLTSGRDPLDLGEVFSHLADRDLARPLPRGTRIGHVHLHVSDLEAALRFYGDVAGFGRGIEMASLGFADMNAGGTFPHRLAVNVWQGQGAPPAPPGTAGLRHYELALRSGDALEALAGRARDAGAPVEERDEGLLVRDPAGNALLVGVAGGA